jgi:hypothetical protein
MVNAFVCSIRAAARARIGSILVKAAGAAQAGGSELSAGAGPVLSTKAAASPNATRRVTGRRA